MFTCPLTFFKWCACIFVRFHGFSSRFACFVSWCERFVIGFACFADPVRHANRAPSHNFFQPPRVSRRVPSMTNRTPSPSNRVPSLSHRPPSLSNRAPSRIFRPPRLSRHVPSRKNCVPGKRDSPENPALEYSISKTSRTSASGSAGAPRPSWLAPRRALPVPPVSPLQLPCPQAQRISNGAGLPPKNAASAELH